MKEILTLQCGHFSSFLGTHYWNFQEFERVEDVDGRLSPFDSQLMFRQVENRAGVVEYFPRTVIFDLKGSLGNLRRDRTVAVPEDQTMEEAKKLWSGQVDMVGETETTEHMPEQEAKSSADAMSRRYRDLDAHVKVWSDFAEHEVHERSLVEVQEYQHGLSDFDVYGAGVAAYRSEAQEEDCQNAIRFFAEECDNPQGIQILVDADTAFGGFAEALLTDVRDDFPRLPIIAVACSNTKNLTKPDSIHRAHANVAKTFLALSEFATACIPISPLRVTSHQFPHLRINESLMYHTAAVLASAFDSLSTPYRLRSDYHAGLPMTEFAGSLCPSAGLPFLSLSHSFPFPVSHDTALLTALLTRYGETVQSLTPHVDLHKGEDKVVSRAAVFRGLGDLPALPTEHLETLDPRAKAHIPLAEAAVGANRTPQGVADYFVSQTPSYRKHTCFVNEPFLVPPVFPHMFSPALDHSGHIKPRPSITMDRKGPEFIKTLPAITELRSSQAIHHLMDAAAYQLMHADRAHLHQFEMTKDDFNEANERLCEFSDRYKTIE